MALALLRSLVAKIKPCPGSAWLWTTRAEASPRAVCWEDEQHWEDSAALNTDPVNTLSLDVVTCSRSGPACSLHVPTNVVFSVASEDGGHATTVVSWMRPAAQAGHQSTGQRRRAPNFTGHEGDGGAQNLPEELKSPR